MLTIKSEELLDAHMFHEDEFISDSAVLSGGTANSNVSQASSDAQLFSTLCEIDKNNYLYLFERCKAYNINARQLRFLEKEHIRRIIPLDQVGIMAEFEYFHGIWRAQFHQQMNTQHAHNVQPLTLQLQSVAQSPPLVVTASTSSKAAKTSKVARSLEPDPSESEAITPVPPEATAELMEENLEKEELTATKSAVKRKYEYRKRYKNRATTGRVNENEYLLDEIIKHDMRIMREEYKVNGILTERDRRRLAAALVEYFQKYDIYMSKDIMENLAVQISNVFPTESKLAWHDDEGRQRRGRLTLKLYNTQRKKLRRKYTYADKVETMKSKSSDMDETTQENLSSNEDDKEAERLQDWLRNNKCENNDEVTQMWYETGSYRTKQLKKYTTTPNGEHLDEVFEKWPAYKRPIGNILMNIDFNFIYPHSENVFYERWPIFMEKIHKLYKLEVRLDLYDRYYKNEDSLSEETKQSILIQLLHAIVRPTRPISPKQMARRYAIAESQNAFSRVIVHQSEMDDYSAAQPMIFIKGSTFNVQKVFVAFRDIRYELKFMDALYTCLQIFQLFKIDFPMACLNFWTFVQIYFFDIQPEPEINLSVVDHIIKFLLS